MQIGAMVGQINTTLDAFANARDAGTAAGALGTVSRQLEQLVKVVNGTP